MSMLTDKKRNAHLEQYLLERNIPTTSLEANSIREGIVWADDHPKSEMVNKDEFIEKVKDWLKNNIDEDVFVKCGNVVKIMDADDFSEYFCKVIED